MKSLRTLTTALLAAGVLCSAQAQGLRPEVGRPLQAAGDLLKAGKAREALAKLEAFTPKIGYPERWRDYSALAVDPADLLGNVALALLLAGERQEATTERHR